MLMVSGDWARMELENQVVGTTLMAFLGSVAVSCLAVAIFTQNAIIALFTCLNVILVVCVLAGFLLNLMSYESQGKAPRFACFEVRGGRSHWRHRLRWPFCGPLPPLGACLPPSAW